MTPMFGAPQRPLFDDEPPPPAGPTGPGRLDGSTAVVTGASGLLGAAMAAELARRGAAVVLLGRDRTALEEAAGAVGDGPPIAGLRCDLAAAEDIDAAAAFVRAVGRPVDLLVHASGVSDPSTVTTAPIELLDEHYVLNLRGPYQLTQALVPMLRERRGRVVFFTTATPVGPDDALHAITDGAVRSMADALRAELAPGGRRVLTVATRTDGATVEPGFLPSLVRTIVDSVVDEAVDVTELLAGPGTRHGRTERR